MNERSHVGLGFQQCAVCLTEHDEVVLLDRRLRNSLEHRTCVGHDLCPKCKALAPDFIALVEASNTDHAGDRMTQQEAKRTGRIMHLRRSAAAQVFNVAIPADLPLAFIEHAAFEQIVAMAAPA